MLSFALFIKGCIADSNTCLAEQVKTATWKLIFL